MKSEPIQTNDPNLTAYAIGEMSPSETIQFEQLLLKSPAAQIELEEIRETISWVRDQYSSELKMPELSDPNLTAYALGETAEMSQSVRDKIELELKMSDTAQAELAEIEETIGWLKAGFEAEVGESSDTGAPLTAYALGEAEAMNVAASEIENVLEESSEARKELEGIEEMAGWLRDGYAQEVGAPRLLPEPKGEEIDSKIVVGHFQHPAMKAMLAGLAAVVTGMLVVGALISKERSEFQTGNAIAETGAPVEVFHKVEVPSALPEQKSFFAIPEVEEAATEANNGIMLASYESVGGMMVPRFAGLDHSQLPDILEIAAFNESVGQKGSPNPLSYISYDNLAPTDILEIRSDAVDAGTKLPGIDAIGDGKPSFGTYRFQNEDSKNLPDEEFGHGELSFEIRSRIVDGKLVETVRLVDTRKGPNGKETKTVKEFVREGSEVGKPIHSLLPGNLGQSATPAVQENVEQAIASEFIKLNSELSSVRDALAKKPTGAELKALESKLSQLIDQQSALGRKVKANMGM